MSTPASLTLTARHNPSAAEARRGIIRVHPEVLTALSLREWDAVSITGARVTAAVVAAAEASIVVAQRFPESGRLLLTVSRTEMLSGELPEAVAAEVAAVERELLDLLIDLALRVWGRRDGRAVDVLTLCVVDLPTAILLQRNRLHSPAAQRQLRAAVRAVLDVGPAQQSKENP